MHFMHYCGASNLNSSFPYYPHIPALLDSKPDVHNESMITEVSMHTQHSRRKCEVFHMGSRSFFQPGKVRIQYGNAEQYALPLARRRSAALTSGAYSSDY